METDKENSKPLTRLDQLTRRATKSFTIINAYVVPRESGVKWLADLEARGVETRILTNSLASTDVAAVHSGYSRYRPALLHNGVELYELKSIDHKRSRQNLFGSSPRSSMHAKTFVVDGDQVVVASFNLDPRSIEDNTELALTIHSKELAQQALEMFEDSSKPEKAITSPCATPKIRPAPHWCGKPPRTANPSPITATPKPASGDAPKSSSTSSCRLRICCKRNKEMAGHCRRYDLPSYPISGLYKLIDQKNKLAAILPEAQ